MRTREDCEVDAAKDLAAIVGQLIWANMVHGYIDDYSHDIELENQVLFRVVHQNFNQAYVWNRQWLDARWNVSIVGEVPEKLKGVRSMWVDGISYSTDGKVENPKTTWPFNRAEECAKLLDYAIEKRGDTTGSVLDREKRAEALALMVKEQLDNYFEV